MYLYSLGIATSFLMVDILVNVITINIAIKYTLLVRWKYTPYFHETYYCTYQECTCCSIAIKSVNICIFLLELTILRVHLSVCWFSLNETTRNSVVAWRSTSQSLAQQWCECKQWNFIFRNKNAPTPSLGFATLKLYYRGEILCNSFDLIQTSITKFWCALFKYLPWI